MSSEIEKLPNNSRTYRGEKVLQCLLTIDYVYLSSLCTQECCSSRKCEYSESAASFRKEKDRKFNVKMFVRDFSDSEETKKDIKKYIACITTSAKFRFTRFRSIVVISLRLNFQRDRLFGFFVFFSSILRLHRLFSSSALQNRKIFRYVTFRRNRGERFKQKIKTVSCQTKRRYSLPKIYEAPSRRFSNSGIRNASFRNHFGITR